MEELHRLGYDCYDNNSVAGATEKYSTSFQTARMLIVNFRSAFNKG